MILSHRIALDPTEKQREYFVKAAGCARFVWNWALEAWNTEYAAGDRPSGFSLQKKFNALKYQQYPWMKEIYSGAHARPFINLQKAWNGFFKKISQRPKFHKKGRKDSFYVANDQFKLNNKTVRLPHIGWIRMRESLRFDGKIMNATVLRKAQHWFISIKVDVGEDYKRKRIIDGICGIDLGIKAAATVVGTSGVENFISPKPLAASLKKLRRLSRSHSRRKQGGSNRRKITNRIARLHVRISNIRKDFWDKITTKLCRENQAIGLETLNVSGMLKNHKLARAIGDVGFYEPRWQLEYKSKLYEAKLIEASQWFPSSKTCSNCGCVRESLMLAERVFHCDQCGHTQDRDVNAASNLCQLAESKYPRLEGNLRLGRGRALSSLAEPGTKPCAETRTN